jgi:hypothetical protein
LIKNNKKFVSINHITRKYNNMIPVITTTPRYTYTDVDVPTTPPSYERRSQRATPTAPHHRRYNPPNMRLMSNGDGLIPRRLFSSNDSNPKEDNINTFVNRLPTCDGDCECTICLSDNTNNDLAELPCGHTFHSNCITQWFLRDKTTCPNCRRNIDLDTDNEFETMLAMLLG